MDAQWNCFINDMIDSSTFFGTRKNSLRSVDPNQSYTYTFIHKNLPALFEEKYFKKICSIIGLILLYLFERYYNSAYFIKNCLRLPSHYYFSTTFDFQIYVERYQTYSYKSEIQNFRNILHYRSKFRQAWGEMSWK